MNEHFNIRTIDMFTDLLYERNLSKNSIESYKSDLQQFIAWINNPKTQNNTQPNKILIIYVEYLKSYNLQATTIQRKIRSIKQYIQFLNDELNFNTQVEIPKIKLNRKNHNFISNEKIQKIIEILEKRISENNNDLKNIRLCAIINMLYSTGLRVSELVKLKMNQLKNIIAGKEIGFRVIGKGMKERAVFLTSNALLSLKRYLENRVSDSEYLWNSGKSHFSRQSVFLWLQELNVKPHDFRHKLASDLVHKGMNLLEVQKIMGHSSIKTTSIYTHAQNPEEEIKQYHIFDKQKNVK